MWQLPLLAMPAAAMLLATTAVGGTCYPEEPVTDSLAQKHSEREIWAGLDSRSGNEVAIFATRDQLGWTIMVRTPQGMLCSQFSGDTWRFPEIAQIGDPS